MNTFVFFLALLASVSALDSWVKDICNEFYVRKHQNVTAPLILIIVSVLLWTWYHWLQN